MKKLLKYSMAIICSIAMLVTLLPTSVFAAESTEVVAETAIETTEVAAESTEVAAEATEEVADEIAAGDDAQALEEGEETGFVNLYFEADEGRIDINGTGMTSFGDDGIGPVNAEIGIEMEFELEAPEYVQEEFAPKVIVIRNDTYEFLSEITTTDNEFKYTPVGGVDQRLSVCWTQEQYDLLIYENSEGTAFAQIDWYRGGGNGTALLDETSLSSATCYRWKKQQFEIPAATESLKFSIAPDTGNYLESIALFVYEGKNQVFGTEYPEGISLGDDLTCTYLFQDIEGDEFVLDLDDSEIFDFSTDQNIYLSFIFSEIPESPVGDNQFVVYYDGRDNASANVNGSRVEDCQVYDFTAGEALTFSLTPPEGMENAAYKTEIKVYGQVKATFDNTNEFTYTPDSTRGLEVNVSWDEGQYWFNNFYNDFNWDDNYKIEINSSEGQVTLVSPETVREAGYGNSYRYEVEKSSETQTLKFCIEPYYGKTIHEIEINDEDFDVDYINNHLDENGYFCYDYTYSDENREVNVEAEFYTAPSMWCNEFNSECMNAWYRYSEAEEWTEVDSFPIIYESGHEIVQIKLNFFGEEAGDYTGLKAYVYTAPESASRYVKRDDNNDCIFTIETNIPGEINLIRGSYPFQGEFQVNYDGMGDSGVKLDGNRLDAGNIYTYEYSEGQGYTFELVYPEGMDTVYKVIACENNYAKPAVDEEDDGYDMNQELVVEDGKFTYVPHSDKGFKIDVYWQESQYRYDTFYEDFDWDDNYKVETNNDGGGCVQLVAPEAEKEAGYNGFFRYEVEKSDELQVLKFDISPYYGRTIRKININGEDFDAVYINSHLDENGYFCYGFYGGEVNLYAEFDTAPSLQSDEFDGEQMTLEYRYSEEEEWSSLDSFPILYEEGHEIIQVKIGLGDEIASQIAGVKAYEFDSSEASTIYVKKDDNNDCIFTMGTGAAGKVEFLYGSYPFQGEFQVNYDGMNNAKVTLNRGKIESGVTYNYEYEEGQGYTFALTYPEGSDSYCKVIVMENNYTPDGEYSMEQELEVKRGKFTYVPHSDKGFKIEVFWSDEQYSQYRIWENFDWDSQVMVNMQTDGDGWGYISLDMEASPEPLECGSRYGNAMYKYDRSDEDRTLYINSTAYDGVLRAVRIGDDEFTGRRLIEKMDSQGRFCIDIPAGYTGKLDISANYSHNTVRINWYEISQYRFEYYAEGGWNRVRDTDIDFLTNEDMQFRVKIFNDEMTFRGVYIDGRESDFNEYLQPESDRLTLGEDGWYYFTIYTDEQIAFCDSGCEIGVIDWMKPYANEYVINYDTSGNAKVTLNEQVILNYELYNYDESQSYSFVFEPREGVEKAYRVDIYGAGADASWGNISEVTVYPENNEGFEVQIYWTEEEYRFDQMYNDFNWDDQVMVKTNNNGNGRIELNLEESENPVNWGYRWEEGRYVYNSGERELYFNILENDGYCLSKVCIGDETYQNSALNEIIEDGCLKVNVPADCTGEFYVYAEFTESAKANVGNILDGYSVEYCIDGQWIQLTPDEGKDYGNIVYPTRQDMDFRITVPEGQPFTGIVVTPDDGDIWYKSAEDEEFFTVTPVEGGTEYSFALPLYTDEAFANGCSVELTYNSAFAGQYVVCSDVDEVNISANSTSINVGEIYGYNKDEELQFKVDAPAGTFRAFAIVNGSPYVELDVRNGEFSYTPDVESGVTFWIIWTEEGQAQFDYDYFNDYVDFRHYYVLSFGVEGGVSVELEGIEEAEKYVICGDLTKVLLRRNVTELSFIPTLEEGKTLRSFKVYGMDFIATQFYNDGKLTGDLGEFIQGNDVLWVQFQAEDKGGDIAECPSVIGGATYTGKALTPEVTLTDGITTLKEGTDYTLSYGQIIKEGTHTVTVVGQGSYTGSLALDFVVDPCSHDYDGVKPTWTWSGNKATASFKCTCCDHVEVVDAEVTSDVITEATCTSPGVTIFTAVVYNGKTFAKSRIDKTTPAATGHSWKDHVCTVCGAVDKVATPTLKSIASSTSSITVKWGAVSGASFYKVLRKAGTDKTWTTLKTVSSTSYTDKSVKVGVIYTYTVQALNKSGVAISAYNTTGLQSVILAKVAKVTVKGATKYNTVTWSAVTSATGYKVYRMASGEKKYSLLATITKASTLTYKDTKIKTGVVYTYMVQAYATLGKNTILSPNSADAVIVPAPAKLTGKAYSSYTKLTWSKVTGATSYKIYKKTGSGKYTLLKTITKGTTVTYTDKAVKKGKTYTYYVVAYAGKLASVASPTVTLKIK